MGYTRFGEFVRILRVRRHEVMGDMATKLGTTPAFLSAVENGKKNVPADWIARIALLYNLNLSDTNELSQAVEESKIQYKIQVGNAGLTQRRAALAFTRSFDNLDDETAEKILELLNKKGDKI